jgi:1-acyl-sn-glycerol-3-phosphate acyltransferase
MLLYYLTQRIVSLPIVYLVKFLLNLKIVNRRNYNGLAGPLIIAPNHKDYIDGIALVSSFPFRTNLLPIRSLVWHKMYYLPILHFLLKITGSMPVFKTKNSDFNEALRVPLNILKIKKGVVVIFPEGKMVKKYELDGGKRGIAYLALKSGAPILPISIKGTLNASFKNLFLRRNKVIITVGTPFHLPEYLSFDNLEDLAKGADIVMSKIGELYYKN